MRKKLVVISGAGVSAESGIKTFRDSDGLWENYSVIDVATATSWPEKMELMLKFYNERRLELQNVNPNGAHYAIAQLEDDYDVTVITQNVDNLHERAGSTKVLHLHGELTKVRPENCFNENDGFSEESIIDIGYTEIQIGDKGVNGAQLRPHVVWFGEAVPNITKAIDVVSKADIILIVGTSLQVYPAASLYRYASPQIPIYIIDPSSLVVSDSRLIHIQEVATKGMEQFKNILNSK